MRKNLESSIVKEGSVTPFLVDLAINDLSFCEKSDASDLFGEFDELLFDQIVALLQSERVLALRDSFELLMVFEHEWSRLTSSQRTRLIELLQRLFGKGPNFMVSFVAGELLCDFYGTMEAMDIIGKIVTTSCTPYLEVLPDMLQKLIVQDGGTSVGRAARDLLTGLEKHALPNVKKAAVNAISRFNDCR